MRRLWDKGEPTDQMIHRFTVGEDHLLDQRLVSFDVQASKAHARMLGRSGYLDSPDVEKLCVTLDALAAEHEDGQWAIAPEEEDCHTALENRLTQRLGNLGKCIHLGRSRNDQVLAALRLYLRSAVQELAILGTDVVNTLEGLMEEQGDVPLPGYTHLQRAMPSSVGDWTAAYASELRDDLEGLHASARRLSRCPLGSAAGYGVPLLELDRIGPSEELGFAEPQEPVTAVQLSRGKAEAAIAFELTMMMQDLGRLAADLCLYASQEFAFVKLPTAFTTGSSIMPQKRNPDVFELIRARSAQFPAQLQMILAITSKMTSGYHRDLQLIKEPLFWCLDQAATMLGVMAHAIPGITFDGERTGAAMDPSLFATERAYRLVKEKGVPFREAYKLVAEQDAEQTRSKESRTRPQGLEPRTPGSEDQCSIH